MNGQQKNLSGLDRKLAILAHAKTLRERAEVHYKNAVAAFREALEGEEASKHILAISGQIIKGTEVRPTTLNIDEAGLEATLGEAKWLRVSKRVLDRKLLEHSILADEVDPDVLTKHSMEVAKTPYVRVTIKKVK